jgi:hypothetical protein
VLAWAAAVPAASAAIIPVPGDGPYGPVSAAPAGAVRVITLLSSMPQASRRTGAPARARHHQSR